MQAVQARTRITLKNILFATDFSAASDAAAPIAIQIAPHPEARTGRSRHSRDTDDHLRHRPTHSQRGIRGEAGVDHRP
jgi:hypothetical protein